MLCAGWKFPTADGKARFSAVALPERHVPEGAYVVRPGAAASSTAWSRATGTGIPAPTGMRC